MPFVQFARHLHPYFDIKIAFAVPVENWHALIADAENSSGLRAFRNLEVVLAIHRRHPDFGADRRLCNRKRYDTMQIVTFAREERMFFHVQDNIKITCRSAELTDFSSTSETDPGAIFHSGGNFGIDRPLTENPALALTFRAWICDYASTSLTSRTGPRNAEKTLLIANLASPVAGTASRRPFAGSGAGPVAFLACFVAANSNFRFGSEVRFFEFQREILAEVGPALYAIATASTASTEDVAEAEELAEDVAEILEYSWIESCALRSGAAQAGVTEPVVDSTLFGVGEDGIRLADFLELLFCIRIIGIAVRMILKSQLAIGGLELDLGDGAGYAQHLVIIAFCICSQTSTFRLAHSFLPRRGLHR